MKKQINQYAPGDDIGTGGGGMDGGGSDGGTGPTDTGGAGAPLKDASEDGNEVGLDPDLGTSDDLGTGAGFDSLSPSGDPRMDDIDATPGTGMLEDDAPSG